MSGLTVCRIASRSTGRSMTISISRSRALERVRTRSPLSTTPCFTTIIGFTGGGGPTYGGNAEPVIMPVVGDWSPPPAYSQSWYDKAREKASPGYYSVHLDSFKTQAELTATRWASVMRFTFPQSERSNIIVNFPRHGGAVEVVGDRIMRGKSNDSDSSAGRP